MSECQEIRSQFSGYLDGAVTGAAMHSIATHLESCVPCGIEFSEWRRMQAALIALGPAKAPEDLGLRLRVALSRENSMSLGGSLARWQVRWENTFRPFLLQASAGLLSSVLLLGVVSMLALPEPLLARDEPPGVVTAAHFLYTSWQPQVTIGDRENPIVVEAFVNGSGRVYDYQIVSGSSDRETRSQLENTLLFSIFSPARAFGQPVRGTVLLSYSGISVHG
jgi:hypothetical protein